MAMITFPSGQVVYDPRGRIDVTPKPPAPRVSTLAGLRLGVLDNTKWNGRKLLAKVVELLEAEQPLREIHLYKKESFSRSAAPELIERIASENDAVITAIGD
jgi:hypothetical protein